MHILGRQYNEISIAKYIYVYMNAHTHTLTHTRRDSALILICLWHDISLIETPSNSLPRQSGVSPWLNACSYAINQWYINSICQRTQSASTKECQNTRVCMCVSWRVYGFVCVWACTSHTSTRTADKANKHVIKMSFPLCDNTAAQTHAQAHAHAYVQLVCHKGSQNRCGCGQASSCCETTVRMMFTIW